MSFGTKKQHIFFKLITYILKEGYVMDVLVKSVLFYVYFTNDTEQAHILKYINYLHGDHCERAKKILGTLKI